MSDRITCKNCKAQSYAGPGAVISCGKCDQALRDENARLRAGLESIINTDRGLEPCNREAHKRYIADDDWWADKRPSHTFEAWIAQAVLTLPEQGGGGK